MICANVYVCVSTCAHAHTYLCLHMYKCVCVYIYACVCLYTHTRVYMCVRVYSLFIPQIGSPVNVKQPISDRCGIWKLLKSP